MKKTNQDCNVNHNHSHSSDAFYGLGVIGAAIYFISSVSGFWPIVLAILKAIIWPVFFVFEALKFLIG